MYTCCQSITKEYRKVVQGRIKKARKGFYYRITGTTSKTAVISQISRCIILGLLCLYGLISVARKRKVLKARATMGDKSVETTTAPTQH